MTGRHIMLAMIVTLVLHTIVAQGSHAFEFPTTRAGEVAKAYLESFNTGDVSAMETFAAEYRAESALAKRPADARAQQTFGLYGQMGPLQPVAVTAESDNSITITVRADKIDMWLSCKFEIEEDAPRKLTGVTMRPTSAPEAAAKDEATIDWDNLAWANLADLLERVREQAGVPAMGAAVVEDGRITDVAVVGVRQAGTDDRVQPDDRFHIGSVGKSMTATMIGRLVELGKLDWHTTIAEVLSDVDMREVYRDVTLEQLLQHRGGLPGYQLFDDADETRLNSTPGTPVQQRAAFVSEALQSEPVGPAGSTMQYSNAGYVIAATMAERRTGRAWEELMREHVWAPMGMRHAGFGLPATTKSPHQPRGHAQQGGAFEAESLVEDYPHDAFIAPAGNVHMSVGDLARYAAAHLAGLQEKDGAVRAQTFARLHAPPRGSEDGTGYAAGWMLMPSDYGMLHAHAGSGGTFFANVSLYPERDFGVVVVLNIGLEGASLTEQLSEAIARRVAEPQSH